MYVKLLQVREVTNEKAKSPRWIAEIMKEEAKADRECFWVLHLNTKLEIIEKELVAMGLVDATIVHPREVFKKAIVNGVTNIITVHNYPSGDLTPSSEDKAIWRQLEQAGNILGIPVQDNLIISSEGYYSEVDNGVLEADR